MTRTAIGGIAAGAFTLGILAGLLIPSDFAASHHDQLMASHMSAMGSMPMMDMSSGPMMRTDSGLAGHETHHASPESGR